MPVFLELEVDEGLEVGRDELVNHEDDGKDDQGHHGEGEPGESDAVAALPAVREPVYEHAEGEDEEDGPMLPGDARHD